MECPKCGLSFNTGATCPSCGHTNIDPAAQERSLAEKGDRIGTPKPKVLCNSCGFRYNSGNTCPSCGHTNSVSDPEYLARQDKRNYENRPKVKTWVRVVSISGIVINLIAALAHGLTIAYLRNAYKDKFPKFSDFFQILTIRIEGLVLLTGLVICLASIFVYINLLRKKKSAVLFFFIFNTLTVIMYVLRLQFGAWQLYVALFWGAIFWFADWSDFE